MLEGRPGSPGAQAALAACERRSGPIRRRRSEHPDEPAEGRGPACDVIPRPSSLCARMSEGGPRPRDAGPSGPRSCTPAFFDLPHDRVARVRPRARRWPGRCRSGAGATMYPWHACAARLQARRIAQSSAARNSTGRGAAAPSSASRVVEPQTAGRLARAMLFPARPLASRRRRPASRSRPFDDAVNGGRAVVPPAGAPPQRLRVFGKPRLGRVVQLGPAGLLSGLWPGAAPTRSRIAALGSRRAAQRSERRREVADRSAAASRKPLGVCGRVQLWSAGRARRGPAGP
jgi:hypothetical protein